MRKVVGAVVLVWCVLAAVVSGLGFVPPAHAATNGIAGTVTVAGAPAEGVQLELMMWSGSEWSYGHGADEDGVTDATGRFSFADLPPGTYTVTVHRRFANGATTPPAGPGTPGAVTIDIDDQVGLDVELPVAPRTVTGQVLELDGTPAAGALVELGAWSSLDHPSYLFGTIADGEGRYALPLYDDQPHTVTAWTPGYLRTLLGDTTLFWEAQSFDLSGAATLATITLQSQYVGGRVTSAADNPVPGRPVALLRWDHAQDVWVEVAATATSPTGRYAFRNTGEGHFTVRAADAAGPVFPTTGLVEPVVTGYAVDQGSGPGYRWVSGSGQVGDLDLALPPPAAGGLRLRGIPDVGRALRVEPSAWARHYVLRYRWLRDGRAIPGATSPTYRLVAADGRRRISARITAVSAYPGLLDQAVTSAAVKVRARSSLVLHVDPGRRSARLAIVLRLPGTTAARTNPRVTVYVDGKRRSVVRLRDGRATLTLRPLAAGRHRIAVRFAGNSDYTAARAVRIVRVR